MSFNLEELDRLEKEATKGPWYSNEISYEPARAIWNVKGDEPSGTPELLLMERPTTFPNHVQNSSQVGNDLKLVAALRNAYPAIAARIRALQAEVRAWREADNEAAFYWGCGRSEVGLKDNVRKHQDATDATGGVT